MRASTRAKTQTRAMARLREQRDLVLAQVQRIAKDGSASLLTISTAVPGT